MCFCVCVCMCGWVGARARARVCEPTSRLFCKCHASGEAARGLRREKKGLHTSHPFFDVVIYIVSNNQATNMTWNKHVSSPSVEFQRKLSMKRAKIAAFVNAVSVWGMKQAKMVAYLLKICTDRCSKDVGKHWLKICQIIKFIVAPINYRQTPNLSP